MMPGGLATAATALICGRLMTGKKPLVDPRILILGGMVLMMFAMWDLGHLSTAAGEADARNALIVRGLALGLLFAPINNVAFGSLEPHEAQQASGLINLARQLGGSFGIAVLGAYLTRHIAYHRADLATNMYPGNPAFAERFNGLVASLSAQGWALVDAQQRALAVLDATMMRQAAMRAYNDAWLLLLASFVCVVPAVFLLRRPGAAKAGAPAAAEAH
jgi:DHA2 family multidrug resistance protein